MQGMNMKRKILVGGGAALAAAALLGGVALAQTPGGGSPTPTPTPTPAPSTPGAPSQPETPRQRDGRDCPDKSGAPGTQTSVRPGGARDTQGLARSAAAQY